MATQQQSGGGSSSATGQAVFHQEATLEEKNRHSVRLISGLLGEGSRTVGKTPETLRFQDFAKEEVCAAGHKTFARVPWMLGEPLDTLTKSLRVGPEGKECEATRMKGIAELVLAGAPIARLAKDNGDWRTVGRSPSL